VELCLEHPDMIPQKMNDEVINRIRCYTEEIGLKIASLSYHGDNDSLDEKILNTYKAIDIAHKMGVSVLIINCEKKNREKAAQYDNLVRRIKDFTSYAEEKNVTLAVEPEPLLVVETAEEALRLIDDVASPNLKVNLDVGHTYITDPDLSEAILKLKDVVVHVHIEDIKGKVHKHLYPLDGDIDYRSVFNALERIGYSGYYVVDLAGIQDAPDVHARICLERLQKFL